MGEGVGGDSIGSSNHDDEACITPLDEISIDRRWIPIHLPKTREHLGIRQRLSREGECAKIRHSGTLDPEVGGLEQSFNVAWGDVHGLSGPAYERGPTL